MKALLSQAAGGPETLVLADRPVPTAGRGELLVKILVCAINYPDVLIIEDKYQFKPERPFAPGSEICAEVAAVGEGVEGWAPGDRLIAVTGHGGLSEYMLLPAAKAFAAGSGVCQDLAHVFIAAARHIGVPARYVAGYRARDDGQADVEAPHGWVEALVPDLGWVAFDP